MSATTFRQQLIALCAERGIATSEDASPEDNLGVEQLLTAITELHLKLSKPAAPEPAAAKPKKTAAKKTADSDDEEAPAPKKPRAKKTAAAEPAAKKAPTKYAEFTSAVTKANKGNTDGWEDVKVTVSLAKVTESGQTLLDHEAGDEFLALKGTEVTMLDLLEAAQKLLTAVDGKVQPFKLSGLLWAAVGNASPFETA